MSLTVEKCLQAWTNSLKQMNAKADIVFFGDSLTYYGDFSSVFPDKVVCNLGLRGDTIQGMINRVEQVKLLEPKIVYLMAGINDVSTLDSCKFRVAYEKLINVIMKVLPQAVIICQSMLPVNSKNHEISCTNHQIEEKNKAIKELSSLYDINYIDLFFSYTNNDNREQDSTIDGIHLKPESYNIWYEEVKCLL